ncbi:MAG TPA: hypothetical protein ENI37_05650 [Chloroflexi bacterium]|nr:hypothetical protein [Chloroflexota bacterium]
MFRRRPLRPPPPGASRRRVAPAVRQALIRAHRALERGDADQAARIFHRLAKGFARRRMVLRAAGMLLEAAHAEALGGKARQAVENADRALRPFTHTPVPERVAATAERLVTVLRRGGHEEEAVEVERMLEDALQQAGTTRREVATRFAAARARQRGQLPAKCGSCGGPLLPNEVEWHGPDSAECPYCGSVIKVE